MTTEPAGAKLATPRICPFCAGAAPSYRIVSRFEGCDFGHHGCRRCGITYDDNVNELMDTVPDRASIAGIADDREFSRLFVETPRIASANGELYSNWDWDDASALARGVVRRIVTAIERHGAAADGGMRILDVGCGNGFTSVGLARHLAGARVLALDPSPQVLAAGREPGVTAMRGTLDTLDATDAPPDGVVEGFDAIVVIGNLMLHANPRRTLETAHRLLRPGGLLLIDFKNARASARRIAARLARTGLGMRLPRSLRERAFLNMRYGFNTTFMRALTRESGFVELDRRSKPPRLLEFANRAGFQRGWKGVVWRLLDIVDRLQDERAWVEMSLRRPDGD